MYPSQLRVVFASEDWAVERGSDVEEPLDEALMAAGVGEIVSGGVGPSGIYYDVGVHDPQVALPVLQTILVDMQVPRSTRIQTPFGPMPAHPEQV